MHYAILSAGEGSRLQQEGIMVPKPLVQLCGSPMISRLISIFLANNAESISIITNTIYPETKQFLEQLRLPVPLNIVYKTTQSSLHSFYELIPYLYDRKFCLTTVDTIFDPAEFSNYIEAFANDETIDGLMAVTSFVDDESPLFVQADEQLNITGFFDTNNGSCNFVSGGIYCLNPKSLVSLNAAHDEGMSRMRNLQRRFLDAGLRLKAYPFSKILDVDHIGDITKAEAFISNLNKPL